MVAPLIIGGGLAAAGAIGSAFGKKEMNARQRRQLDEIIKKLEREWQTPEYDSTPITPEEFKVLSEFVPEIAPMVAERYPQVVTEASAQPYIQAQREALQRLQRESVTGEDVIAAAGRERAAGEARAQEQALRAQALSRLAASGRLDPAAATMAELGAGTDAATRARQEYMNTAAQQEARRRQALMEATQLAGTMREGEYRREASAADVINEFNRRAVDRRQTFLNQAAQQRNQAQLENQRRRQGAYDANVQLRNQIMQAERQRQDQIAREKAQFSNQLLAQTTGMEAQKPVDAPWWYAPAQAAGQMGTTVATYGLSNLAAGGAPAAGGVSPSTPPSQPGLGVNLGMEELDYQPSTLGLTKPRY